MFLKIHSENTFFAAILDWLVVKNFYMYARHSSYSFRLAITFKMLYRTIGIYNLSIHLPKKRIFGGWAKFLKTSKL